MNNRTQCTNQDINCNKLGNLGESVIELGLSQVYKRIKITPKEINAQLKNADITCQGFPKMGIPDVSVEVKTEFKHTGNFFWETWSDKTTGRQGWGYTSEADDLYYLFWDTAIGYRIAGLKYKTFYFPYLKKNYPEIKQTKNEQGNESWGCLIPVDDKWLKPLRFDFNEAKKQLEKI